jgi:hypothetical protein
MPTSVARLTGAGRITSQKKRAFFRNSGNVEKFRMAEAARINQTLIER